MPIYEYCCSECGDKFEKLVRYMSSTQEVACPRCGSHNVAKAVSLCGTRGLAANFTSSVGESCAPAGG